MDHKVCRDCGAIRPAAQFYRHNSSRDGLSPYCRDCQLERSRLSYVRRAEARPVVPESRRRDGPTRLCNRCKTEKPIGEYWRDASRKDGISGKCKACKRTYEMSRWINYCKIRRREARELAARSSLTDPNLLDLVDRSERRADLAEIGGLPGVHRIKERYRRLAHLKEVWGEVPPEVLDAEGLELPSSPMADERRRDAC